MPRECAPRPRRVTETFLASPLRSVWASCWPEVRVQARVLQGLRCVLAQGTDDSQLLSVLAPGLPNAVKNSDLECRRKDAVWREKQRRTQFLFAETHHMFCRPQICETSARKTAPLLFLQIINSDIPPRARSDGCARCACAPSERAGRAAAPFARKQRAGPCSPRVRSRHASRFAAVRVRKG